MVFLTFGVLKAAVVERALKPMPITLFHYPKQWPKLYANRRKVDI